MEVFCRGEGRKGPHRHRRLFDTETGRAYCRDCGKWYDVYSSREVVLVFRPTTTKGDAGGANIHGANLGLQISQKAKEAIEEILLRELGLSILGADAQREAAATSE